MKWDNDDETKKNDDEQQDDETMKKGTTTTTAVDVLCHLLLILLWTTFLSTRHSSSSWRGATTSLLHRRLLSTTTLNNNKNVTTMFEVNQNESNNNNNKMKILYIVTSATEYNNGRRQTIRGEDRYKLLVVPTIVRSVYSMIEAEQQDYHVDVYLIVAYTLTKERIDILRNLLPSSVHLYVWNDAVPLWYDPQKSPDKLIPIGRALARQHRYVIKDYFTQYDFFVAFEDDMHITGNHINRYLTVQDELKKMMIKAPLHNKKKKQSRRLQSSFHGELTKSQLSRMRPGFIRTEIRFQNTTSFPVKKIPAKYIPTDYYFNGITSNTTTKRQVVDPSYCCQDSFQTSLPNSSNETTTSLSSFHSLWNPESYYNNISSDDLLIWETSIEALSIQELPNSRRWVVLLPGCPERANMESRIQGYWSGTGIKEVEDVEKPDYVRGVHMAQGAGWMATRDEILDYHIDLCNGYSFLPPFQGKDFHHDGLHNHNVEFWSGGLQLFCRHCSIQRVIPIDDPNIFSQHFMYHTSNNKQRQVAGRTIHANILYGQLNTVRKHAIHDMENEKGRSG